MSCERKWLEMFLDFISFYDKHFANEGYNTFYETFKESIQKTFASYITLIDDKKVYNKVINDVYLYDVFQIRMIGSDDVSYIKVEYTTDSTDYKILDCYLVDCREVVVQEWVKKDE